MNSKLRFQLSSSVIEMCKPSDIAFSHYTVSWVSFIIARIRSSSFWYQITPKPWYQCLLALLLLFHSVLHFFHLLCSKHLQYSWDRSYLLLLWRDEWYGWGVPAVGTLWFLCCGACGLQILAWYECIAVRLDQAGEDGVQVWSRRFHSSLESCRTTSS